MKFDTASHFWLICTTIPKSYCIFFFFCCFHCSNRTFLRIKKCWAKSKMHSIQSRKKKKTESQSIFKNTSEGTAKRIIITKSFLAKSFSIFQLVQRKWSKTKLHKYTHMRAQKITEKNHTILQKHIHTDCEESERQRTRKGLCADNNNQWQWDNAQRYSFTLQIISHMYRSTLIFVSSFLSVVQTLSHFNSSLVFYFILSLMLLLLFFFCYSIQSFYLCRICFWIQLCNVVNSPRVWIEFQRMAMRFPMFCSIITQELHFMLRAHFQVIRKPLVTHAIN